MKENDEGAVVLPGGSGLLGRIFIARWRTSGTPLVVLSRDPRPIPGARVVAWDGLTPGPWCAALEGARAVVNLAGRSVDCRYGARNRRAILNSRVDSTRALGEAIAECARPPAVWLNASSATVYRHAEDRAMDEATGELGDDFSPRVVKAWEAELERAPTPRTRKVALRAAMVLASEPGGVLQVLARLARLGLGGTLGPGTQLVSWIHADDFCRAVELSIERDDLDGPVNLSAPNPIPNAALMAALRRAVGRRFGLPATRWMLELGAWLLRTETELVLKSRNVVPRRLLEAGFRFDWPEAPAAIEDLLKGDGAGPRAIVREDG